MGILQNREKYLMESKALENLVKNIIVEIGVHTTWTNKEFYDIFIKSKFTIGALILKYTEENHGSL